MWRQAWLKLMICRSHLAESEGYILTETKGSDDKGNQTIRMTSFQELCSIVLSVSESVDDSSGIQEPETATSDSTEESSAPEELDQSAAEANGQILSNPVNDSYSLVQNLIPEQTDEMSPLLADVKTEAASPFSANNSIEAVLPFSTNFSIEAASPLAANVSREAASPFSANASTAAASPSSANGDAEAASPFSANVNTEAASPFSGDVNTEAAPLLSANVNTEVTSPLSADVNKEAASPLLADVNSEAELPLSGDDHVEAALQLSADVSPEVGRLPLDVTTEVDEENLQGYASAFIQIAVKRFLVEKDLSKHKKVGKSQALMHGHFVTEETIGAFQLIRRIRKMQELFKTRHAHQSQKGRVARKKVSKKPRVSFLKKKPKMPFIKRKPKESATSGKKPKRTSTLKLLYNVLAHQLSESTPEMNPNHLASGPVKPDSAWQWLEKRLAHTSSDIQQEQNIDLSKVFEEEDEKADFTASDEANTAPAVDISILFYPNSSPNHSRIEDEGNHEQTSSDDTKIQVPFSTTNEEINSTTSSSKDDDQHNKEDLGTKENIIGSSNSSEVPIESVTASVNCSCDNPVFETESPINATDRTFCKRADTKRNRFSVRTRKGCNPTFAYRQKFGKLNTVQVTNLSVDNEGSEGVYQLSQSHLTTSAKVAETSLVENPTSHESDFNIPPDDCSTEISFTPHMEGVIADGAKVIPEIRGLEREGNCNSSADADTASNIGNANSKMENTFYDSQGILDKTDEKITSADSVHVEQHPAESTTSIVHMKLKNLKASELFPSSPEGSPRTAVMPELHGAPSTQIPVSPRLSKTENKAHPPKQLRSPLAPKSSQSSSKNDSSARSSVEHLQKEVKNSNRRNSFAIVRPDHAGHDTKIGNSNILPSYMQTTESVRAKFHSDLKSIPDIQEKDNFVKKRHSLHIEHGKLGLSTNMQRSVQ